MTGTLYGVGVGPGDPELITLKAHRLVSSANVIAYLANDKGASFARSIIAEFIDEGVEEIPVVMPMKVDRLPAQMVYDEAAQKIAARLDAGENVVVLCEGDPFFYGSFIQFYERLGQKYRTEIIPGISSVMVASAVAGSPLAVRNDIFCVIPAPSDNNAIENAIKTSQSVAIIKLGRHFSRIRALLEKMGVVHKTIYLEHVSLEKSVTKKLTEMDEEEAVPYFSLLLVQRSDSELENSGEIQNG